MKPLKKKGASFFTVDAMIAGVIIIAAITLILAATISRPKIESTQQILNNYIDYITNTKIDYYNKKNRVIYYNPNEPHPEFTITQKIAYLVDNDQTETATSFIKNFSKLTIPKQISFRYIYENQTIYTQENEIITPTINLTTNIPTFYINDEGQYQGPKLTQIQIWTK
ncbi:hypothetical protein K9L97_00155 [Candidatus Woesearchaeota archaeon]|nr:hypothetical protein [Candidatus Woesearchaeota archaeon]